MCGLPVGLGANRTRTGAFGAFVNGTSARGRLRTEEERLPGEPRRPGRELVEIDAGAHRHPAIVLPVPAYLIAAGRHESVHEGAHDAPSHVEELQRGAHDRPGRLRPAVGDRRMPAMRRVREVLPD